MTRYVEPDECLEINRLRDEGVPYREIADRVGRSYGTVVRHCRSGCRHKRTQYIPGVEFIDDIHEEMRQCAESEGAIPTPVTWDGWSGRKCSSDTVRNEFGAWNDILEQSGLPPVDLRTPRHVRELMFKNPSLAKTPLEQ